MREKKYTVEAFDSGRGYFVHGGKLGEMFIENKEDAEGIAEALNLIQAFKAKRVLQEVEQLSHAIETFRNVLEKEQTK